MGLVLRVANRAWVLTVVFACLSGSSCAPQQETLGAIQQRAIAECEVSSRGSAFAACYKAFVDEHRLEPRRITPEEDRVDFFLDRRRTTY